MTNSILIGKVIYQRLSNNETIKGILGDKIFPLVADNNTTFPFIVYKRTNVIVDDVTKDGFNEDTVSFEVIVVTNNHEESLNLANEVRKELEKKRILHPSMILHNCMLAGVSEEYSSDSFVQKITFTAQVNNP